MQILIVPIKPLNRHTVWLSASEDLGTIAEYHYKQFPL